MMACQSLGVVVTVNSDVITVLGLKALYHLVDVVHSFVAIAHRQSREVGVSTRAVPVGEKLGCEGNINLEILGNTLQEVATNHHVVTNLYTKAGSNLILPLARHDLGVSASNLDTGKEAGFVVHISDDSTEVLVATDRAVVGSLRAGVAIGWPAKRVASELSFGSEQGVLLLNSVPRSFIGDFG